MLDRRSFLFLALTASCGLSVVGPDVDGGARAVGANQPLGDGGSPTPPCTGDACALPRAEGPFRLVLFGDPGLPCPDGFATTEVVANPVAGPSACGCGPCTTTASCQDGVMGSRSSGDATCGTTRGSANVSGAACQSYAGFFADEFATVTAPASTGGRCSAPGIGARESVVAERKQLCVPVVDACAAVACAPPGSLRTCLEASGDQTCPAELPNKELVGEDVTIACTECSCRTSSVQCGGTTSYYKRSDCSDAPFVQVPAGVCTRVSGASIAALRWTGSVVGTTCADVVPGTASVALANVHTVCCGS